MIFYLFTLVHKYIKYIFFYFRYCINCPPKWINNVEVGRYSSKFEGTHYVLNENLAKNYPIDIAVMHEIISAILLSRM